MSDNVNLQVALIMESYDRIIINYHYLTLETLINDEGNQKAVFMNIDGNLSDYHNVIW